MYSKLLLLRPLLGLSKSGIICGVVLMLNIEYSKCPKISNTLFHIFLAELLLFNLLFHKIFIGKANSVNPDQTASLEKHIGLTKAGRNSGVVLIWSGCNSQILLYFCQGHWGASNEYPQKYNKYFLDALSYLELWCV